MKIICDSMFDIPNGIVEKYDITVIPLTILMNNKEYIDRVDITNKDFYKILRNNDITPKTSQATYARFKEIFDKYTSKGEDVLYIGGSSSASGTFQSATMASQDVEGEGKVYLFDTQTLSIGAGLFLIKACEFREKGLSIEEILGELDKLKGKDITTFFVDDLKYLQKGGRISSTKATVGTLLKIKPILVIEDGLVQQHSQVRGLKQVYNSLIDIALKDKNNLDDKLILVGYCDNKDGLDGLQSMLSQYIDLDSNNVYLVNIGAVIASHSGPSVIGIATV